MFVVDIHIHTSAIDRANENAFTSWGAVYHSAG